MTDFRRQVRRAQTKTYRWGTLKKSNLRVESSHCRYLAYNRYGVIGVSLTHQWRATTAERWEDRRSHSPLRAFGLRGLMEQLHGHRGALLPKAYSLSARPAPTTALDTFNRRCYYPERLALHLRGARRPFRRPLLLLRPLVYTRTRGFTNAHRFPRYRATLRPFQYRQRRRQARSAP